MKEPYFPKSIIEIGYKGLIKEIADLDPIKQARIIGYLKKIFEGSLDENISKNEKIKFVSSLGTVTKKSDLKAAPEEDLDDKKTNLNAKNTQDDENEDDEELNMDKILRGHK